MFICAIVLSAGAGAPPSLPRLALDSYPAAAREAISRAHRDADRASNDAEAVGRARPRAPCLGAMGRRPSGVCARAGAGAASVRVAVPGRDRAAAPRPSCRGGLAARQALIASPDYLPARVKLAESLLETDDLDESQRLFEALVREPAAEPAAEFGLGRIAAAKGLHDAASPTCSARSGCFRNGAPRITRSPFPTARLDAGTRRSVRSSGTRRTDRAGPPWRTRSSPPSTRSGTMRGRVSSGA